MATDTEVQTEHNSWKVEADPHSEYRQEDGQNVGGLKVVLVNKAFGVRKEVCRVAFNREMGETDEKFEEVFEEQMKLAMFAANMMNQLLYHYAEYNDFDPDELLK